MSKNVKTQIANVIGQTLNSYHSKVKPTIDNLKFKEEYQSRIIDCMVGEVDDNYIETPETNEPIVKLEYSKEGLVKVPSIKGKTILVDADGNETDTPAEGCKLVSVGEDEDNKLIILSNNKNLLPTDLKLYRVKTIGNDIYNGVVIENENAMLKKDTEGFYTSIDTGWTEVAITELIKINPKITYSMFAISKQRNRCYNRAILFYNKDKEFIGKLWDSSSIDKKEIVPPLNAKYMRLQISCQNTKENNHSIKVFMLYGKMPNNYNFDFWEEQQNWLINNGYCIEPKSHKTEILLNEPLKSLPNGVCDEIVGNRLIRRIGKLVLNGTESWRYSPPSSHSPAHPTGEGFFMINNGEFIDNVKSDSNLNNGFCNIFSINKNFYYAHFYNNLQGIGWQNYFGNKYIFIRATEQFPNNSVEEFKNYLKDNNAILYYELKEPIIIELPNSITLQGFDDTTMYIENSITPTVTYGYNALIPYKEELLNQREEVEINTLDIENNIIPYLMDMEYNLMTMEDK